MIRRLPDGQIPRWGVNLHIYKGRLMDVTLRFHRRIHFYFGRTRNGYDLDFRRDHRMYRPNDVDSRDYFFCRRCMLSNHYAGEFCKGHRFIRIWRSQ